MMRPMKLAGSQLLFGEGCLAHLQDIGAKKAFIVIGGRSMEKNGVLAKVEGQLQQSGCQTMVFKGVEPDPSFATVQKGTEQMLAFEPDLIVALGGGSPMDAAKMMWVYYEHPEFTTLEQVLQANPFPPLRQKAKFCCIPSTAGTGSEVSRSVVISDENGVKHGLGNMEMMPDIAICDPEATFSMPPSITAETGMDAMTHALEALVSSRANYVSDVLVKQAVQDIYHWLPIAFENGGNVEARENMLNASMIAGMAFTNVSLGIVHSMAHAIGSLFHVAHGLADAILLPYTIDFNSQNAVAKKQYAQMAKQLGQQDMAQVVRALNEKMKISSTLQGVIPDTDAFEKQVPKLVEMALADGCTKTNPVLPTAEQLTKLLKQAYYGK